VHNDGGPGGNDLQLLQAIHRIESELDQVSREVKQLEGGRVALIANLPESRALAEALRALYEARLRIAVRENREGNKLEVDLAEVRFKRRDLKDIHSHHLVVYTQDTGATW
jgi:NADPH:quinone reductase-like Zn-dependent oxidoreductase